MNNEELRIRALNAVVRAMEYVSLAGCRDEQQHKGVLNVDYYSLGNEMKRLAEAYATIEKAGHEANMYDVIKGMYGTGIKGSTE